MKPTLLLIAIFLSVGTCAQIFPIQVNTQLVPPYSPYLSDYTAPGAQKFIVQIRANDISITDYRCKLRITIEGVGITIKTKTNFVPQPLMLQGGGIPQVLYGEDLAEYFHPNALDFSGLTRREYTQRARLPEGLYQFTVEVLDYNRGTVVSNSGMAMAWIILNDPPFLNMPSNFSKLEIQNPTNILFSWTPRHSGSPNAAFTSEYTFRLIEIWPLDRNPHEAFLTQVPLFETTTTQNQVRYGMNEPALIAGRKYAWQVEARDTEGRDLFRNKGRSEVFVFQFGEALPVPGDFELRWAKPTTLSMRWDPVRAGGEEIKYRLLYRPRRRQEDHQWYETRTQFTEKTLYHLQPNTEYEMKVRTESPVRQSEYTDIRIFRTLRPVEDAFVCKDLVAPPPPPAHTVPVFPLSVNDTLHAGGYDVLVRDVIEVEGRYYGSGVVIVPWFNSAKVRVTFEDIRVNDRFWLTRGTVNSVWNAGSTWLLQEETPILPGKAPKAGELDITIVAADSLIKIEGAAIASVSRDGQGNIVVTTTDGKEQTLPRTDSYAIVDQAGNEYVIDEQGNVAKTTAAEAHAAAARGNRTYERALQFLPGDGIYGFDEKKYDALSLYYQQLHDGSYVAWKALSSTKPDEVEARLQSGEVDIADITFQAGVTPVMSTPSRGGAVKLRLQGKMAGMEQELLALYSAGDTLPEKTVGKINLATYDPIHYNLEIVPVNGASLPAGLGAEIISESVNDIFGKAVVEWRVTLSDGIQVALPQTFNDGESGALSNYTGDMKKVLNAWGRLQDNTYYLFLIKEPRNPTTLGYMPRDRQAGFVFVGPHKGDAAELLKTIGHELGHGAFNLKHTFSEHNLAIGTTDNLMDYSDGTALYKYQWDYIHEPRRVVGLFENEKEAARKLNIVQFEAELMKIFGAEAPKSDCKQLAIARGYQVYKRFDYDFEIAMYAGFLRLLLCETEAENCNNENQMACGFTNGILLQFDWITTLETAEGWNIEPKEILKCALNSIPVGAQPDDRIELGSILYKCLVGIDIADLVDAIRDFIIENYDEPYYQGQATAFAITLLSPYKAKLLEKLAAIPRYAKKISSFKILSKARTQAELASISKSLVKLIDDAESAALSKSIKYLPGPRLPPRVAASFSHSIYSNRKLLKNERFFKYHGMDNRTGRKYTWLANKKYSTEKELRKKLAIREDWGVDIKFVSEFDAPAGTWVSEGRAASQGTGYPGGDYQAVILNIPKGWIIKTTKAF